MPSRRSSFVDEQGGIADPLGMLGNRLEVAVHLVTGNVTRSKTLADLCEPGGHRSRWRWCSRPLATAEAGADPRRVRAWRVLQLDIGVGTTEYALFFDGEVQHSGVMPMGAGHFTNDLAMVLRTPFQEAERIKVKYGCCLASMVDEEDGVSVPTVAGGSPRASCRDAS